MAKWVCKVTKSGGQHRLTIPKGLIKESGWVDIRFVTIEWIGSAAFIMRRLIDGESLKDEGKGDKS